MKEILPLKKSHKDLHSSVKFTFILLAFIYLTGCLREIKPTSLEIPKNLLPKDTLEMLLKDLLYIEGVYYQNTVKPYLVEEANQQFSIVFNKYHCSFNRFKESLEYYQQFPDSMIKTYDQVMQRISIEESTDQSKNNKLP